MQRVKRATAVAVLPAPPLGGTPGFFTGGNPQTGQAATVPGYEWHNGVQEELCDVVEQAGLVLSDTDHTQLRQAIQSMIANGLTSADAVIYKGVLNCAANPNYPSADAGHLYRVSVPGKIGGVSGPSVEVGDTVVCSVDASAAGNHASVGANWNILQVNIDGAVIGPPSVVSGRLTVFNGVTGKVIQDGGAALSTDGTFAANSDAKVPTEKATETRIQAVIAALGQPGLVPLNAGTALASASHDISIAAYAATYKKLVLVISNGVTSANVEVCLRTSNDGSIFPGGGADYTSTLGGVNDLMQMVNESGGGSSEGFDIDITMRDMANAAHRPRFTFDGVAITSGGTAVRVDGAGCRTTPQSTAVLRIFVPNGTVSFTWKLYGYK